MKPKGELEKVELEIDNAHKAEIIEKLMKMKGVKSIEPENSHIKVDSLGSVELADEYKDMSADEIIDAVREKNTVSEEEFEAPEQPLKHKPGHCPDDCEYGGCY